MNIWIVIDSETKTQQNIKLFIPLWDLHFWYVFHFNSKNKRFGLLDQDFNKYKHKLAYNLEPL